MMGRRERTRSSSPGVSANLGRWRKSRGYSGPATGVKVSDVSLPRLGASNSRPCTNPTLARRGWRSPPGGASSPHPPAGMCRVGVDPHRSGEGLQQQRTGCRPAGRPTSTSRWWRCPLRAGGAGRRRVWPHGSGSFRGAGTRTTVMTTAGRHAAVRPTQLKRAGSAPGFLLRYRGSGSLRRCGPMVPTIRRWRSCSPHKIPKRCVGSCCSPPGGRGVPVPATRRRSTCYATCPGRPPSRSVLVALLLCTCRRWDRVTAKLIAADRGVRRAERPGYSTSWPSRCSTTGSPSCSRSPGSPIVGWSSTPLAARCGRWRSATRPRRRTSAAWSPAAPVGRLEGAAQRSCAARGPARACRRPAAAPSGRTAARPAGCLRQPGHRPAPSAGAQGFGQWNRPRPAGRLGPAMRAGRLEGRRSAAPGRTPTGPCVPGARPRRRHRISWTYPRCWADGHQCCGWAFALVYGQFAAGSGLQSYYTREGFTVLEHARDIDLRTGCPAEYPLRPRRP